ncbi:hypothetical protein [Brevundimonas sp.]|uniref:hypothetical protein n=1 Tax=Brevundimonas sp. TaxID=1871086 RepID=UPI003A8D16BA
MNFKTMLAALAMTAILAPAAMAQTESVDFTLSNKTRHTMITLYLSVPSTNNWEEDILGNDVLEAGESMNVSIDDGLEACVYDIRADFDDGDSVQVRRVNFCELDGEELIIR